MNKRKDLVIQILDTFLEEGGFPTWWEYSLIPEERNRILNRIEKLIELDHEIYGFKI